MEKYSIKCKICNVKLPDNTSDFDLMQHYKKHEDELILRENFKRVSNV